MNKKLEAGFEMPQIPQDQWAADLKVRVGLPVDASLEQIEPRAVTLLAFPQTVIPAAELVLGRRVDAKETDVISIVVDRSLTPEEKFGGLLIQKSIEDMMRGR